MGPTGPILHHAPTFTVEEASRIAHDRYDLIGFAAELPSERDQNFLLTTHSGEKFILKIANATEQRLLLEAQNDAMTHLASRISFCPRVVLNEAGESLLQVQSSTSEHFVRLVTFIPGLPLAEVEPTPQLLFNFGRRLGEFSRAISDFDHRAFHRDFHWDLVNGLRVIDEYSPLVANEELRMQVERCRTVLDKNLDLPSTIIHGDANNYNVLIQDEDVVGLIDFGDMVYSLRVGDLAIALAYVVLDKMDPLSSARTVVAGYLSEVELNKDEIELVWPLMLTRLGMSVCIAAHQRMQKPENEYLDISQRAIRNSLPRLLRVEPKVATGIFLSADDADYPSDQTRTTN
jgi:Ser/Thr protein kinase RdoA (MazF antagonist)